MASQQQSAQFSQSVRNHGLSLVRENKKRVPASAFWVFWLVRISRWYRCFIDTTTRELPSNFRLNLSWNFVPWKKYDKTKKKDVNLSYSSLGRYRSALKHYLRIRNTLSASDLDTLSAFFCGLKKRTQNEKQAGERPLREGKAELPVALYEAIAKYFYSIGDVQNAAYLVLTWNLACRTNNTADLKLCHIGWLRDVKNRV